MSSWDYVSKRRGLRLEDFVAGAESLEAALEIFRSKKMSPPQDGSLEALFSRESDTSHDAVLSTPDAVAVKEPGPTSVKKKKSDKKNGKKTPEDWGIVTSKNKKDDQEVGSNES